MSKHDTLREEEKQIIMFLIKNRGRRLEAEIARVLEMPRTTAWRHIRNLEEAHLVITEKAGPQNVVKLK